MEKASFDRLNKLFGISTSERHHQTLLIDQNLLVVVRESQSFVFPILSCLAPKVLEPNEHHTLNDLPFYEEVRAIDAKAQQDQLESREKKCQEGMLKQAPGGSHPATSSTALPQTKGKSISQSTGETLDFSTSTSSPTSSSEASTNQGSTDSPSIGACLN